MKRLPIVTVITFAIAAGCATSPRATSGPSPNVTPRDTVMTDTTRDTTRTYPRYQQNGDATAGRSLTSGRQGLATGG